MIELDGRRDPVHAPAARLALYQAASPAARRHAHAQVVDGSTIPSPARGTRRSRRRDPTPPRRRRSRRRRARRSRTVLRSPQRSSPSSRSTRRRRTRRRIGTGEPLRQLALISQPEKARGHGRSPSSSWSGRRPVLRAPRRWCSCPRPRVLQRAVGLMEEALVEAASQPALQVRLHQNLADDGRLIHGLRWAERHAREAVELADRLDDDGLRAGALSTLAFLRFGRGDPRAPGDAERAYRLALTSGDDEQRHQARLTLGHVLVWSAETERARDLFEVAGSRMARAERASYRGGALVSVVGRAGRGQVGSRSAPRRDRTRRRRAVRPDDAAAHVPARARRPSPRRPRRGQGVCAARQRARRAGNGPSGRPRRDPRGRRRVESRPGRRCGVVRGGRATRRRVGLGRAAPSLLAGRLRRGAARARPDRRGAGRSGRLGVRSRTGRPWVGARARRALSRTRRRRPERDRRQPCGCSRRRS